MRYTGIQPQYFPRLHYFARILNTDIFVLRDEVQFVAKHKYPVGKKGFSYQADTPIKQVTGVLYLHVPISHDGLQPINKTKVTYSEKWVPRHLNTIKSNYMKSPNFTNVYQGIEVILKKQYETLAELNITTILWGILMLFNEEIKTSKLTISYVQKLLDDQKRFRLKKIVLGSQVRAYQNEALDRNSKIIESMKELGADEDYCGETGFAAYMDRELFEKNGIKVVVQNWKCKEYPQLFARKQPFIPNLSIIDLLMNVSRNEAVSILEGGTKK